MPALLPLFPATTLPTPLSHFDPATALPNFTERVRHLRRWQQAIKDGYVRSRKEEALQAEFLDLLFGEVLGYEYQATTHRQLQLELKTLTDGTKPDGALGDFVAAPGGNLGGPVRAVVELKDARTALDAKQRGGAGKGRQETPVEQAFSYPSKFGGQCRWVLVSNFVELRLYSAQDQSRAEVFNLETLPDQPEQLRRFFALLLPTHLLPPAGRAEAPLDEALQQRQQEETKITKAFYKDYSAARRQLLDHLIEQNPTVPPLELLAHTQKLLDRVIFVCFCEDKSIIPRLTFRRLLDNVRANIFDPEDEDKVYRSVRGLFRSIDKGNPAANINRFNGGLFAPDAALDALAIKDYTLRPVIELEKYDFASDLNVNILGHIFEQSLSDLEAERARLLGQDYNAKQGKRKQDGIFYTPEYITRYIVRQAVGGWLQERRREAGLDALPDLPDDDRATIRLGVGNRLVQPSRTVQKHIAAWETYATALENIRVLDPACGSGAFLNEAFGYLLREGQHVNQELATLRAGQFKVFDLDRHILQHNLYGVDLNPESVDITRLSLWLQTANPGKPLTSLDHSIRCGNSLISDPAVAGPRAFDWQTAFPEVFEQGGFDVVIGNPPYGAKLNEEDKKLLSTQFSGFKGNQDVYSAFIEKTNELLDNKGNWGFVVPVSWQNGEGYTALRKFIKDNNRLISAIKLPYNVFTDAYVDTGVYVATKATIHKYFIDVYEFPTSLDTSTDIFQNILPKQLSSEVWHSHKSLSLVLNPDFYTLVPKISHETIQLSSISESARGILSNSDDIYSIQVNNSLPFFTGDANRYIFSHNFSWVVYGENLKEKPKSDTFFKEERILVRRLINRQFRVMAIYTEETFVTKKDFYSIKITNSEFSYKYILSIINSSLISYLKTKASTAATKDDFSQLTLGDVRNIPIKPLSPAEQQPFIAAAEALLAGHKELHEAEAKAGRLVQAELGLTVPLTGKLALTQPWKTWSTALEKALSRKLTLAEKGEWLPYLEQFQQQQEQRRAALQRQDTALDQLVYQLYQLTPEEIALVEGKAE
ncbi:N-6 DNA methylase [Hymenobacter sp. NBH84]|uniref:Eco57I restriction-modification methylase domain-containing protein n=1 Tax=Hymenobacter sp. NBH84 TaxID=2596915 RepID=UPI00162A5923|nr:N-6 DNA methylase [Hymenobacter sp. NBH84]QNE39103.1 N-6 DNA methylase [Hymenobacter sp. NBH84]